MVEEIRRTELLPEWRCLFCADRFDQNFRAVQFDEVCMAISSPSMLGHGRRQIKAAQMMTRGTSTALILPTHFAIR